MKKQFFLFCITICVLIIACSKEEKSERFKLLTTPVWTSESFVATGTDTSGVGAIIKQLKGDAKFNEDGTGYFGSFTGQWRFNPDETEITIVAQSLPLPIVTEIILLTAQSLKLNAPVTIQSHPQDLIDLLMTFKAK